MTADPKLLAADARRRAARQRLMAHVDALKARLAPGTLAANAVGSVKERASDLAEDGLEVARTRPGVVAGTVGGIGLLLFRKRLWRLLTRRKLSETVPGQASLTTDTVAQAEPSATTEHTDPESESSAARD